MILIDKLAYSSPLRGKSPFLKSSFAVGSLLICVGAQSLPIAGIIALVMATMTLHYGKLSLGHYAKLLAVPLGFLLMGTLAILFQLTKEPLDLFNIALGSRFLAVSLYSLTYTLRLIAVAMASVMCLYFLTLTTPFLDLLYVLRRLRCPALLVELMLMTYRYIFVILDMAAAISLAQRCRLGNINRRTAIKGMGTMLATVLVRSLKKASLLFDAMESRCYDGEIKVLYECNKASSAERTAVTIFLLVLMALAIAATNLKELI